MPGPQLLCLHQKTNGAIPSRFKPSVIPMFPEFSTELPAWNPVSFRTPKEI